MRCSIPLVFVALFTVLLPAALSAKVVESRPKKQLEPKKVEATKVKKVQEATKVKKVQEKPPVAVLAQPRKKLGSKVLEKRSFIQPRFQVDRPCFDSWIHGCRAPESCYGMGFVVCKQTCNDCDGRKYADYLQAFHGSACVDVYPTERCIEWAKDNSDYGCKGPRSSVAKGCRKTCGNCR